MALPGPGFVRWLAGAEAVAAVAFCLPRVWRGGGIGLLVVFGVALTHHAMAGQFAASLFFAALVVCMALAYELWIYLGNHSLIDAIDRFTQSLRRFAVHCGVPEKYHETITWAYLLLIHERMQRADAPCGWESFRAANVDLFDWKPSILERYYAPHTLRSDFARRIFVLPDRGTFPV